MVNAEPDISANTISKKNHLPRKEFILNIPSNEKLINDGLVNFSIGQQQIEIFPNPANQIITVSLLNTEEIISSIRIRDINGKMVRNANLTEQDQTTYLDISYLNSGAYLIECLTTSG